MSVRIEHGDCLEVMRRLIQESVRVDAIITDPPYCSGGVTEAGRGRATHHGLRSEGIREGRFAWFDGDNMTTAGLVWLLREMAVLASELVSETGSMLVFCDWRMAFNLGPALESAGFRLRNLVVWDKGSMGLGTGFRPQHELVLHLAQRAPEFHTADIGNVIRTRRIHSSARLHPTEKPVELMRSLIRVVAPPGGTVLDPFLGSGATLEAAIAEGRQAIGIERDADYVSKARERLMSTEISASLFAAVPTEAAGRDGEAG